MSSRLEANINHVEDTINGIYDLSKSPQDMLNILDGVLNTLMYDRHIHNWKVNIDDINDPEILYQISRADGIRIVKVRKVERNNTINEILNGN